MGSEVSGKAALASSWAWMRPGHAGGCGDGLWDVPRAFPSHPLVSSPARAGGLQSWGKQAVRITTPVLRAAKSLVMLREKSLQAWKKSLQNFFLVLKENVHLAVLIVAHTAVKLLPLSASEEQEHKKHHGGAKQGAGEVFFSNDF